MESKRHVVEDVWQWNALAEKNHWTDGLPVLPPTPDRVQQLIEYAGRDAQELLGLIPPMMGGATVEKIAIQAVMAGCKPQCFPVVLASVEAMLAEESHNTFNLRGVQDTTHCATPLVIVSGPIVKELGFHYRENAFGGGISVNASVGRALRLVLWNVGGARPGVTDMTHLGHPGKYAFLVAENPERDDNPWPRIGEDHGYGADTSTVTVLACEAPRNILVRPVFQKPECGGNAETALRMVARAMASVGSNNFHFMGQMLATFGPRTAEFVADAGYTKDDVRRFLFENSKNRLGDLEAQGFYARKGDTRNGYWTKYNRWVDQSNPDSMIPVVDSPESIHIIVTGSGVLPWNSICYGWGCFGGYAVTRPIRTRR